MQLPLKLWSQHRLLLADALLLYLAHASALLATFGELGLEEWQRMQLMLIRSTSLESKT